MKLDYDLEILRKRTELEINKRLLNVLEDAIKRPAREFNSSFYSECIDAIGSYKMAITILNKTIKTLEVLEKK